MCRSTQPVYHSCYRSFYCLLPNILHQPNKLFKYLTKCLFAANEICVEQNSWAVAGKRSVAVRTFCRGYGLFWIVAIVARCEQKNSEEEVDFYSCIYLGYLCWNLLKHEGMDMSFNLNFWFSDSAHFCILRNVRILGKKRLLTLWWHSMKFYKSDLIQYRETGFQENKLLFCVYLFLILIQKNRFSKSLIHSGIHVIRRNWKNIIGLICTFNQFATPINCVINCRWCTHHYHQFVLSAIILVQNGLTGCSHFPYQSELWGCALILSSQYFVGTWTRLSLWRTPRNISGVLWHWCGKPKRIKKYGQNTRCHCCWPNNKLWK